MISKGSVFLLPLHMLKISPTNHWTKHSICLLSRCSSSCAIPAQRKQRHPSRIFWWTERVSTYKGENEWQKC